MLQNNLKQLLKIQNTTLTPFSNTVGIHRDTIRHILLGTSKNPGVYTVAKIADVLNISIDELIGRKHLIVENTINRGLIITNLSLLHEVTQYIFSSIKQECSKVSMDAFLNAVKEIYKFSVNANNLDKNFADWYIEKHLQNSM